MDSDDHVVNVEFTEQQMEILNRVADDRYGGQVESVLLDVLEAFAAKPEVGRSVRKA